jgi:hypothetical protein
MNWLKWIVQWIWTYVFGCFHRHTTWPHHDSAGFDYIVCLDCSAELPYSVREMRMMSRTELALQAQIQRLPGKRRAA